MLPPSGDRRRVRWLDALITPYDAGCVKTPNAPNDRHKMTSLCHLLQFLAIGVYAILRRDLVRGILRDWPVARGRVALQVAARRLRPQWIWSLRPRGIPMHGANLLTEFIRSNRAQLLLANHRLRSASNLQFSCRQLPLSNSEQRGALRGDLWLNSGLRIAIGDCPRWPL